MEKEPTPDLEDQGKEQVGKSKMEIARQTEREKQSDMERTRLKEGVGKSRKSEIPRYDTVQD